VSPIRVLVVDDSVVIRRVLTEVLGADPEIEVVGTAVNGRAGLQKVAELAPDLVTLDVEMPELDGLGTLAELARSHPRLPVIMFSTLTARGAAATLEALALGAKDYVCKPSGAGSMAAAMERVRDELVPRIKALAGRRRLGPPAPPAGAPPAGSLPARARTAAPAPAAGSAVTLRPRHIGAPAPEVLAIGSSTGGPKALEVVLSGIGPECPVPVVVVQHMPPVFTQMLAQRLDQKTHFRVTEAVHGTVVEPGHVYVAPGDHHLRVVADVRHGARLELDQGPPEHSCRPAVDVLFRSVAAAYGARVLGVVLTGMGQDGLKGSEQIVAAGGCVLAQDEATSVVWGMPGFVARAGLAEEVLPLEHVAGGIEARVRARVRPVAARAVEGVR
jgi:two-component system chemotaxis response regulator CheB